MNTHTWITTLIEGWNTHDVNALLPLYAPDFQATDLGQAQTYRGAEGLQHLLNSYFGAFPDLRFEVERTIVENENIALLWTARGTHQGKIMSIPPTGREITVRGVSMITLGDSKIKDVTFIWDVAGLLRGIGLLPDL